MTSLYCIQNVLYVVTNFSIYVYSKATSGKSKISYRKIERCILIMKNSGIVFFTRVIAETLQSLIIHSLY